MKGTSDIHTHLVIFRKQVPVHEHIIIYMYMFVCICVLLYVYTFILSMQMGKRKFRPGVQRKNHERKRWGYYPVRIPIKGGISVFKVSVPLSALSSDQRTALLAQPPTAQPPIQSSSTQTPLLNSLLSSSSEPVVTTFTYVYVHIYTCLYVYVYIPL